MKRIRNTATKDNRGVYFLKYELLVDWGKKFDDCIIRKKIWRVRGGKKGKKKKFSLYLGGKIHFGKMGGGPEILII